MKTLSLILSPIILCVAVNRVIAQTPMPLERNQEIGPPAEMPRESGRDRSSPYREPKLSKREKELVFP